MEMTSRPRRSARLTETEHSAFKKAIKKELTRIDAAEKFGVSLPTLTKLEKKGRGAPETIERVKTILTA